MAAVFIPPSHSSQMSMSLNMSTRRPPLANVPNATNSPHRTAGLVPAKRSRTSTQLDIPYGQPPPKKQVVDGMEQDSTRNKATVYQTNPDTKLFTRRSNNAQPSAFEKKLVAARDNQRQSQTKITRHEKPSAETIDSIRQWQRHYRKAFPQFVFYFDSIPEDLRSKCSRQVVALGAREEKFFSRVVTHVITSRPIPADNGNASPTELNPNVPQPSIEGSLQTVNPSLLEKNAHMSLKNDSRREQSNMDVLHRARKMGMKIWALEKLQRMISTINDSEISGHHGGTRTNHGGNTRARGDADLSQVLRNELLNGPSDRDPLSSLKELVMFKGPFIYVHDMDEKTKPVMVREYQKPAKRQDGLWPQFRSAPLGKCPFIDEPPTKKELERQKARQQEREKKAASKHVADQQTHRQKAQVPQPAGEKDDARGHHDDQPLKQKQPEAEKIPLKPASPRKSSESFIPPQFPRTGPFYHGREPAASGVQPSNITSAIRSQMVSSTAAAPGAKAGLSKEVHELKRKVLEKSNGSLANATGPPHRTTDPSALKMSKSYNSNLHKSNTQEKLANVIEEDTTQSEGNGNAKRPTVSRKCSNPKKKERRRDPKPGYCENCRDKFDDFEEHVLTRKHRKFATTTSNWAELDDLLFQLERPLKPEYEEYQ